MGGFWSAKNECDEALEYVDNLIVIQDQNIDRIDDDIFDLEEDYVKYTGEHEKSVTLSLIQTHTEYKNIMFTNLAKLKEQRLRLTLLKTKILDGKSIENETVILNDIKQNIAQTERNIAFNQTVKSDLDVMNANEITTPDAEQVLDIRSRILSKHSENTFKNTYTLVFSENM